MSAKQSGPALEALGDPSRRAIVESLAERPKAVGEIASGLPISRPAVSRHLRLLEDAGLVDHRPDGTRNVYRLHDEGVRAIADYFTQLWSDAATRFTIVVENTDEA